MRRHTPPRIVDVHEVMIDLVGSFLPRTKLASTYQFSFELSKHTLCRCIVGTGPDAPHADLQVMLLQTVLVGFAGVLTAVIENIL